MQSSATATQADAEKEFYRIGDVSRITDLKPFVLRYWETEFPMLEPMKTPAGHRLYRQEDLELVLRIKRLLYDEGFTIAGARRHLREQSGLSDNEPGSPSGGSSAAAADASAGTAQMLSRKMLLDLRDSLRAFLTLLERK